MLILEIAAGIVLGFLLLAYWRQAITIGVLLLLVSIVVVAAIFGYDWIRTWTPDDVTGFVMLIAVAWFAAVAHRIYKQASSRWRRSHESAPPRN